MVTEERSGEFSSSSPEATRAFARRVGALCRGGEAILLFGDLGAGKTCFVQGLAAGLGVPEGMRVTSPTFTIHAEYPGRLVLNHLDLYRLDDPVSAENLGVGDMLADRAAVTAVEWPEMLADGPRGANAARLEIRFETTAAGGENVRLLRLSAFGEAHARLLEAVHAVPERCDEQSDPILLHKDERLGHVAIDMRLMNAAQVKELRSLILLNSANGMRSGFGQAAVELGFITPDQLRDLEAEENRRRHLITGYEIIDIIGAGTIATVYHARQIAMDRDVALKILHPRLAGDPVFVRAYMAEAQAVSRFHHPHIVQGFDAGESNGFHYFAHEYLPGGSIADRLNRGGDAARFSETRLLACLHQTTSALKHAWTVAVYHGDINPGNLLLDAQRNIKLANLGVPRVAGLRPARKKGGTNIMPGFVRCGPEYTAPEQLEKPDLVNASTDIYSLGATFYHISFGAQPFPGDSDDKILAFRKTNPMPSFALERQEGFSAKYLRLVHDMLDPDPRRRPADPEALADRLERFHLADADDSGLSARPARPASGASSVSTRMSQRLGRTVTASEPGTAGRDFSLRRRPDSASTGRNIRWLWAGFAAAALAAAGWLLKG